MFKNKQTPLKLFIYLTILMLLWSIIVFIVIPNAMVIITTFYRDGEFSFGAIEKIYKSKRAVDSLRNSFLLAFTLPITTSIVGILQVLFIEYFEIKGSKILSVIYLIPLVFGGLLINNGYLFAYGPSGLITNFVSNYFPDINRYWFQGYFAVMLVLTFGCTTNYIIFFRNTIKQIDYYTIEAAKNLGASQWEVLSKVVFPQLRPIISTCVILLFQQGLGAMSAPLIVGGKNFQSISPLILTLANRPTSRDLAAILSLILGFFQIILLYVIQRNEKNGQYLSLSKTKVSLSKQKIKNKVVNIIFHLLAYLFALIHLIPFLAVIIFSFTDYKTIASGNIKWESFTFANYFRILTDKDAYGPFLNSIIYAGLAALIVAVITIFVARLIHQWNNWFTSLIEYLMHIPWLLPGILFALGLVVTYSVPNFWMFNKILTGSWIIMLIAYIVVMLPNTLRFTKAAFFGVDNSLEEAAANLGAGKLYTFFKVVLPTIVPTALALFALNFNGKLADYDLTAFLYHPLSPTLGIIIRSNADPTAAVDAAALNLVYSVILIVINSIVIWLVYFDGFGRLGKFMKRSGQDSAVAMTTESLG
ncbi:iron ABC transporter permease [Ignavigranum ruoffiae]|uniref:ABC transporter permease n=1 Tax=Ignavigranum ruoffiae TaxID=89093 RepID=UPI00204E7164|nr:iron ABC transporter permease [Ignavigranum ruoffiae]UPQ85040.1 iron ABC transporter permease [Ignavigranum ruoffiae]